MGTFTFDRKLYFATHTFVLQFRMPGQLVITAYQLIFESFEKL